MTPTATMMTPMPTMTRKAKNGMIGFGRSSGLKSFSPLISPSHSWVRIRLPRCGTAISKWLVSAFGSGNANRISGTSLPVSQCASSAAILAGWYSSVFSPCRSPSTICSGASQIEQAQRHAEHDPAMRYAPLAQDVPGADAGDDEGGGEVGGRHHMGEAVGEGRVEDDVQPVA